MVGTSVRDRMNDQIMANTTASASGTNRKRATPCRKNIGTNTMQMHNSETNAGTTICAFYDGAIGPYISYIEKFRSEFEALCRP